MESPPVVQLLTEQFISSWSLVVDLEDISNHSTDPQLKGLAALALKTYEFPVQSIIYTASGELVHTTNANSLLDSLNNHKPKSDRQYLDPLAEAYLQFLETGIEKAKELKENTN